jgi:hypothetical protein
MATELVLTGATTGSTVYAIARRNSDEKAADQVSESVETYAVADHDDYDIAMPETPVGSAYFVGDLPSWMNGTKWNIIYYQQLGATPAATDTILSSETISPPYVEATDESTLDLITIAEYKNAVSTTATDDTLDFLIGAASRMIENYCDLTLIEEDKTEYVDGHGFNYIQVSGRPSSITTITLDPEDDDDIEEVDGIVFGFNSTGLIYYRPDSSEGSYFEEGYRNVKVEYTTLGTIPDDLKQMCIFLVQNLEMLNDTQQNVISKDVGDVKIKYDKGYINLEDPMFYNIRIGLNKYRKPACI